MDELSAAPAGLGLAALHKHAKQRVAVLIDDDNLTRQTGTMQRRHVDYPKLLARMDERETVRTILYRPTTETCAQPFPPKLVRLLRDELGVELKTPPKNADCWLTVDAVTLAEKADVIALVAGDKDYEPLVHYLKSRGCCVEVWSWGDKMAGSLRRAADRVYTLDEILA